MEGKNAGRDLEKGMFLLPPHLSPELDRVVLARSSLVPDAEGLLHIMHSTNL